MPNKKTPKPELTPQSAGKKLVGFLTKTPKRSRTLLIIVIGLITVALISVIF